MNEGRAGPRGRAARRHLSPLFLIRSQGHFTEGRPGKTSPLITKNSPFVPPPGAQPATLGLADAGTQRETRLDIYENAACKLAIS